jgi:uridine kinase
LYELEGCIDYFYGYMAPHTGLLKYFALYPYSKGFVLQFPNPRVDTHQVAPFEPANKLFGVLEAAGSWSSAMEIPTVGALNDAICQGKSREIILSQEAYMERRIGALAEQIAEDPRKKFVMIAGPSSSGKTTFSHRLSAQLRALGVHPHPIPLDDYYYDRDQVPLDEFGEKDFECIEALDIEQFNQDMMGLLQGQRVLLPTFNFKTGKREYRDHYMQLGDNDILVIEGIHGLNDRMSYALPRESKFKIYISALTQLNIDEHNSLSTTDGRLIRRIVRDARTRGTSARDTIAMWDSVRRGEEKNIFPFQEKADEMFNSALVYEMAVLKTYAQPQLFAIPEDCREYIEAKRLLKLLDYFLTMPTDDICNNSLIREFIGGSCFNV